MISKRDMKFSKFISLVLRHKPETIGIKLDSEGFISVNDLIKGMNNKGMDISREDLDRIVKEDNKQRYSYNNSKDKIRANQGHSIPVNLNLKPIVPPSELYHGTGEKYINSILKEGIKPKTRQYVHLSKDIETAIKVGVRHGKVVILKIDIGNMIKDGYIFYKSENGVYLIDFIPTKYIRHIKINN